MNICFVKAPVSLELSEHDAWMLRKLVEEKAAEEDAAVWRSYWLTLACKITRALELYYQRRIERTWLG